MEVLSAPRLPAGSEELADSGPGLHNQSAVVVEAVGVEEGQSWSGKDIPFPTRRMLSDRRLKSAVAEAVLAVLAMILRRGSPLLPLHNHLSPVVLRLRRNLWMTEYRVFSAEVAACRYHPVPQLRQLLRPVMSTCGR